MNYLTEGDQFKEILNYEEISRIKDNELRQIGEKYWELRHKAFIDENDIPDDIIGDIFEKLIKREQEEIENYKMKKMV